MKISGEISGMEKPYAVSSEKGAEAAYVRRCTRV